MANAAVNLWKMNGAGNEIIVADMRGRSDRITPKAAVALASNKMTAFDQIMEVLTSKHGGVTADIRIHNRDGSTSGACGNGMRCVTAWLHRETGDRAFIFRTRPGILEAIYETDQSISVDMGVPRFDWESIPISEEFQDTTRIELQIGPIDAPVLHTPSVANMGNPHAVFWVEQDVWSYDLHLLGPLLENHPIFPERANISIAKVESTGRIILRTWERGVGLTKACGSAACAALVCAVRKELTDRKAEIVVPGGVLEVEWLESGMVRMTGPAQFEFEACFNPLTGEVIP